MSGLRTSTLLPTMAGLIAIHCTAHAEVRFVRADAPPGGDGHSWRTAHNNPQAALAAAIAGDQLWIAAGDYAPTVANGDRAISFNLVSGVEVYGGFAGDESSLAERDYIANVTTLTGDLNGNDVGDVFNSSRNENAYRVVIADAVNAATVLDGVTITGGQATGSIGGPAGLLVQNSPMTIRNCAIIRNRGNSSAGVGAAGPGAPVFRNCTIAQNRSTAIGSIAGLVFFNVPSAVVTDCRFLDNVGVGGGAGIRVQNGVIDLVRCTLEDNISTENSVVGGAGGVYVVSLHALNAVDCVFRRNSGVSGGAVTAYGGEFTRCLFEDNHCGFVGGGAVAIGETTTPATFTDCVFLGNSSASTGGAIDFETGFGGTGPHRMVNCLFSGNVSQTYGGAVMSGVSSLAIINCSFSGNHAGWFGGAVSVIENATTLSNCIAWANSATFGRGSATQVHRLPDAMLTVNYSCIQSLDSAIVGVGNIQADPLLIDADGGDNIAGTNDDDLRLNSGSPAIDAADNNALPLEIKADLDGAPRFVDDPSMTDTGVGPPPIIDMGCYERQAPLRCPADTNNDDTVNVMDLLAVIGAWGSCAACATDINGDGVVNVSDLLTVIANWGACP